MHRLYERRSEIQHNSCGQVDKTQRVGTFANILSHPISFGAGGRNKNVGVVVSSTDQQVVAASTKKFVVSRTAGQSIVQTVTEQGVGASTTDAIFNRNIRAQNESQVRGVYRLSPGSRHIQ